MSRTIRNLCAVLFVLSAATSMSALSRYPCPPELQGACDDCFLDELGYVYNGCYESCETNWDICGGYCGYIGWYDDCDEPEPGYTCGNCRCQMGGSPSLSDGSTRIPSC
jgi:hypothetical protein